MKIVIGYDGSESADRARHQARELADHGAELARKSGFDATPRWIADNRDIARAIVAEASKLDVDLVVLGGRGLTGVRAFLGSVSNHGDHLY